MEQYLKKRFFAFLLILLLVLLFWYSATLQHTFFASVNFLERYTSAHSFIAAGVFVGLAALSAMLFFFSSVPLVPVAILLWGQELTLLMLLSGWLAGAIFSYLLGRQAIYPILKRIIPFDEKVEYYRGRIPKAAEFWLVLLFRLGMPSEIPGYVLGALRYNFAKYFLATFLAELPFVIIAVLGSEAFLGKKLGQLLGLGILGLAIIGSAFYFFSKRLRKRNE